jgi:hypothetical protein
MAIGGGAQSTSAVLTHTVLFKGKQAVKALTTSGTLITSTVKFHNAPHQVKH